MTDNELIAEFMGLDIDGKSVTDGIQEITLDKLKYSSSWDWLMPVVDKIKVIYVTHKTFPDREFQKVLDSKITVSIEKIHERIVHFIKWYNEYEQRH
jgi:hypothetical protein